MPMLNLARKRQAANSCHPPGVLTPDQSDLLDESGGVVLAGVS